MKKVICLLLCALLLWNVPGPASGTETGTPDAQQGQTDSGDSGGASDNGDSGDSGGASDSGDSGDSGDSEETEEAIQLTTPTQAGWGRDYRFLLEYYRNQDPERIQKDEYGNEYVDYPGMMYWSVDDENQRRYRIDLYLQDPENGNVLVETVEEWKVTGEGGFESNFRFLWAARLSGEYYFTVRAVGDGVKYLDSEIKQSNVWTYEAPEDQLTQPARPRWKGSGVSESSTVFIYPPSYDVETNADTGATGGATVDGLYRIGFAARWWFSAALTNETPTVVVSDDEEAEDGGDSGDSGDTSDSGDTEDPTLPKEAGTILTFYPKSYEFQPSEKILGDFGSGYYSVQIRALSADVAKVKPSDWSPLSMVRYIAPADADLTAIVERVDKNTDALNRQLAINNVRKFGAYKLMELMAADVNNTGAVAAIAQLENITGNYAQIVVSGGLDELFPEGKISVVGAGLNVDLGQTVVFDLGQAQADEVPSTLYSHAVRFSMQLLDVNGASLTAGEDELKVPVKITLPVPDSINPSFFVILHHRTDGTVETIQHTALRKVEGQWYASFLVTHFSDFTMAEQAAFMEAKRVKGGVSVSYRMNAEGAEAALCAVREKSGRLNALETLELSESQKSVTIPCDSAESVQLFLLDARSKPVTASLTVPVTTS